MTSTLPETLSVVGHATRRGGGPDIMGDVRFVTAIIVFGALAVAGCATGARDADEDPPAPAPVTTAFATIPPPSTTTTTTTTTTIRRPETPSTTDSPVTTSPVSTSSVTDLPVTTSPVTTSPVTTSPVTTSPIAPSASVPTAQAPSASTPVTTSASGTAGPIDVDGESSADEPTFDIGPQVPLDVDLVRFPIDDAGQGGTAPGGTDSDPGADGDAGDGPRDVSEVSGWAAVDRYLESQLIRPGNTAASYAVSIGGDVVHTAAFGDRDPALADPAEPGDRFRIASISKPITAIVALSLVEDGTVGLDEPVGQRLAEHVGLGGVSAGTRGLTLRQLLTHRSGYSKYQSTFFGGAAADCVDAGRRGLAAGASGGGYTYSNMNYCLAGLLIEALTGQTYEQAVYTRLLTPLGLSGMRLPPTIDPGPDEVQHVTTPGRNYMETLGGAGAWIASPTDLVTILDALDLATSGHKPLSQQMAFDMVTPPGGAYGDRGYGLGLISYGAGRFGHTGTIESTHAMVLNRGDGVTWAITVAGTHPSESTDLERIMDRGFEAGGFVDG